MKNNPEVKTLGQRIRALREIEAAQENARAAESRLREQRSSAAGRAWAEATADVQTLRSLERALKTDSWRVHNILARYKIADVDEIAFSKAAVEAYQAAVAEVDAK